VLFLLVCPAFSGIGAFLIDLWLHVPWLAKGFVGPILAVLLVASGTLLVEWTIGLHVARRLETSIPVVATRQLITTGS
jgi:hypothetical protein